MTEIDLNALLQEGALTIEAEHPDDRKSRLTREEAHDKGIRHRNMVQFYVVLCVVLAISAICLYVLFNSTEPTVLQAVTGLLAGIVSGGGGFVLGKQTAK